MNVNVKNKRYNNKVSRKTHPQKKKNRKIMKIIRQTRALYVHVPRNEDNRILKNSVTDLYSPNSSVPQTHKSYTSMYYMQM